jgi:hypothetical protein
MPEAKWYVLYTGKRQEGDTLRAAENDIAYLRSEPKVVRSEIFGTGPWYAVKVQRGGIYQKVPPGAIGPYFTPFVALSAADQLNDIAPLGPAPMALARDLTESLRQMKMDLEPVT